MEGDVPVDSEVSVVTLSISRLDLPVQSLGGAHRGRGVHVCVHMGECMRVYVSACVVLCFVKKKREIHDGKYAFARVHFLCKL